MSQTETAGVYNTRPARSVYSTLTLAAALKENLVRWLGLARELTGQSFLWIKLSPLSLARMPGPEELR